MARWEVVVSDEDGEEYYICENPPSQAELETYFKKAAQRLDPMAIGVEFASHLILQPVDNPKKGVLELIGQLELSDQEWFRLKIMLFWALATILTNREAVPTASY